MKINLKCRDDIRHNYLNIDDVNPPISQLVKYGNWRDLNSCGINSNTVEEIVASHVLELIPCNELVNILLNWKDKLKVGGEIYLESIDYNMLGNMLIHEQMSLEEVNNILCSQQEKLLGIYNLNNLDTLLRKLGFMIVEKGYSGYNFLMRISKL